MVAKLSTLLTSPTVESLQRSRRGDGLSAQDAGGPAPPKMSNLVAMRGYRQQPRDSPTIRSD